MLEALPLGGKKSAMVDVKGFDMVPLPVRRKDRKDAKPLGPTTPTCAALTLSSQLRKPFAYSCAAVGYSAARPKEASPSSGVKLLTWKVSKP